MSNAESSALHSSYPAIGEPATPLLSMEEKVEYLYDVAIKVAALVEAVTPQQIEQVKRIQTNPMLSRLFSGIIKSAD